MKHFFNKIAANVRRHFGGKAVPPVGPRQRALEDLRSKPSDLKKYVYLAALQKNDVRLFYDLAIRHTAEILPLIYTPIVGQVCQEFSHLFREMPGLHITPKDKGKIRKMLDNWPADVRAVVVTDGQRILGLGDLGANGMGISVGKLTLYTVCGGLDPAQGLPVVLDVGTDNKSLRDDPLYLGYPHPRLKGREYDELMKEFIDAVKDRYPKALIQFEDFQTANAFKLLDTYRNQVTCFNDDIQGTAAVALAGILAAGKKTGLSLKDQRIMFLGAGSAATGIAGLVVKALQKEGLSAEEAKKCLWLVDSKGLVVTGRDNLEGNKKPFAQDHAPVGLMPAIWDIKPTVLIGATGVPGTFTREVVEAMAALNEYPVIFALSNPTDHAECTAQQAYEWSKGRTLFASGSPFAAVEQGGQTLQPGQANNAYIFPGLALGVILSEAKTITDEMFLAAAKALADMVGTADLKTGTLYPPLSDMRQVSATIAEAVMKTAHDQKVAGLTLPSDLPAFVERHMYDPARSVAPQPKHGNGFNRG